MKIHKQGTYIDFLECIICRFFSSDFIHSQAILNWIFEFLIQCLWLQYNQYHLI